MEDSKIEKIFQNYSKNNPNPTTELEFTNNFTLAVSVILSAQATDISVNKATRSFFKTHDTPEKMLDLGENELKIKIKTIGLYNSKAKNIITLCKILIDKYNSKIPKKFDQLIELPGIGRKTANVILNCAFGKSTIAVDTHVFRVSHKIGLSTAKTSKKVEQDLLKKIPLKWRNHAHHWLLLHGRYICKARKPLCMECKIREHCNTMINQEIMNYPEIKPLERKATKLLVMLHGVGSDGNDLISLVPFIQHSLPTCHFISPHGIEPYNMAPFGRQWFSLIDKTPTTIIKLVNKNIINVLKLIESKQKELELTNTETIIFGFSQGTMIGINLTLSQKKPFAAMIGFSGKLILPNKLKNTSTPICIIHGEQDDIVPASESSKLAKYCKKHNIEHKLLIVPNLTHSIDTTGIKFALNFLKENQ